MRTKFLQKKLIKDLYFDVQISFTSWFIGISWYRKNDFIQTVDISILCLHMMFYKKNSYWYDIVKDEK